MVESRSYTMHAKLIGAVAVLVLSAAIAGTGRSAPPTRSERSGRPAAYLVYTGGLLGQLDPCG